MKINKDEIFIPGLILLISIIITVSVGIRRYGDASYKAMAYSLFNEGDLIADNQDIARFTRNKITDKPVGAFIQIHSNGVMKYSKPILYPLLSAPFLYFGIFGAGLLNGLFLGGILLINYSFARRNFSKLQSLFISMLFVFCGFMPVYAAWMTPEMMLFFFCCLCVWLGIYKNRAVSAALIIGIVSSAKTLFLVLIIPVIIIKIAQKEIKEAFKAAGMCLLGIAVMSFLTFLLLGEFLSYSGLRGYFFIKSPHYNMTLEILRDNLFIVKSQFDGFNFHSWRLFFINLSNFFVGRFTGIVWYAYPGLVTAGVYLFLRKKLSWLDKIKGDSILIAVGALILILIIARPLNYFGGRGFIGNRYFFILPALFFLPSMKLIKKPRNLAMILLPGLLISSQIIKNQFFFQKSLLATYKTSQYFPYIGHMRSFPLKYAPLEIHQVELFIVPQIDISKDISLYAILEREPRVNSKIYLDKGEEIVIVRKNKRSNLKLETSGGEFILEPEAILEDRSAAGGKSFYYFRANQPIQIRDIITY